MRRPGRDITRNLGASCMRPRRAWGPAEAGDGGPGNPPAGSPGMCLEAHEVSATGVPLEPVYDPGIRLCDRNVVERVETVRKRRDRAPGAALVCRNADEPLVGNCNVPRSDDTVASARAQR